MIKNCRSVFLCVFACVTGCVAVDKSGAHDLDLRAYEKESLDVVYPGYEDRFLKEKTETSEEDPLGAGNRKLLNGDPAGARAEYHRFYPVTEDPVTWQAQINSMIANRQLGRFVDAMQNNEELIKSGFVPNRIKAFAQRNAAHIAFYDLCFDGIAKKYAEAVTQNPEAPESLVTEMNALLETLRIKRETKALSPSEEKVLDSIASRIRPDHPRMFFNRETFPKILEYLKRPDVRGFYQSEIKKPASDVPDEPKLWDGSVGMGRGEGQLHAQLPKPVFWGTDAARCALVYLVEKDPAYLEKAKTLLRLSGQAAVLSFECKVMAGDYYSEGMIYALSAYDWLYNDLTPDERAEIIKPLLEYVYRCRTEANKFVSGESLPHQGGFYGTQMLKWYAGLAAIGDHIDEETARKLLCEGYREHQVMLDIREVHTSDDGGFISTANNYVMYTYPWTSLNYFLTFESATGKRPAEVKHLEYFPQWCIWNIIHGPERKDGDRTVSMYDFGIGDTGNTFTHKVAPDVSLHMLEIMHILWDQPEVLKACSSLLTSNPYELAGKWPNTYRPLTPFFLYRAPPVPENLKDRKLPVPKDHARLFEEMGVLFMRSGSTSNDTYACFVTGKKYPAHRHYDANHFMIYKYDFLALDTGTRIGFQRHNDEQLNNYYCQSIAHNTILIHMPKEKLPDYWTVRKEQNYFNDGGQDTTIGDQCVAYETGNLFTYVAGDATKTYSSEKCRLALRQFVFIYPDIFVIADRVTSTNPDYRKDFLLHTQNKPILDDASTWHADDGGGRMFCRTLLPDPAVRRIVGGKGHEFEASGHNWELPEAAQKYADIKNYLGRYRVEISPKKKETEDVFLHVIQVGADTMPKMVKTELLEDADTFGTAFETAKGRWEIRFRRSGPAAGSVRLQKGDAMLLDRPFREDVQPQSGLMEFTD